MAKKKTFKNNQLVEWIKRNKPNWRKFRGVVHDATKNKFFIGDKEIVSIENAPDVIKKHYFDVRTGYTGVDKLYARLSEKYVGITRRAVSQALVSISSHQQHRNQKPQRTFKPIIVNRPVSRWQVDLVDVISLKGNNRQYTFLLTCVDVFSKYAYVRPLRNKQIGNVVTAMKDILDTEFKVSGRKPTLVQSDRGAEFDVQFKEMLEARGIKQVLSSAYTPQSQGAVESFNGYLKRMLHRYFTANDTKTYTDVLDDFVDNYNNSKHTTTKKVPKDIHFNTEDNREEQSEARDNIHRKAEASVYSKELRPFKIGDHCRVSLLTQAEIRRQKHRKGVEIQFTKKIYKIIKRVNRSGVDHYRLQGEKGLFHVSRLLYTVPPHLQTKTPADEKNDDDEKEEEQPEPEPIIRRSSRKKKKVDKLNL